MGTISTNTGLISGLDFGSIIDQLVAIEERPKQLVQQEIALLNSRQVAFQEVNAKLLSSKLAMDSLVSPTAFNATTSNSSNENVLKIDSGSSTPTGSFEFNVERLVSTQQTISRGFADAGASQVGVDTQLTFEFGDARLSQDTRLSAMNGGQGIERGAIRVTDRSGASTVIDLSRATRASDVLDAINEADGVNVSASLTADGFQINDNTGLTTGNLTLADVGVRQTASSLGIAQSVTGDTLTGTAVNTLGEGTTLSSLNDGNGVRRESGADLRIVSSGSTINVDLSEAKTVGDVLDAINDHADNNDVTASINGSRIELTGAPDIAVTARNDSLAAFDLGIEKSTTTGTLSGDRILASLGSRLLKSLNGGFAAGKTPVDAGQVSIEVNGGGASVIDLSSAESVKDVIDRINDAGLGLTASINEAGHGITIAGAEGDQIEIADATGNLAAFLKIDGTTNEGVVESGDLNLQYVSEQSQLSAMRGGAGVTRGLFRITDSGGASATVDLTQGNETTIEDVIGEINSRGLQVKAKVNETGDGIRLIDEGPGAVAVKVEEAGSTTAAELGLLGEAANPGEDLVGTFAKTLDVAATDTLDDVRQKINDANLDVRATIINDGSGSSPFRLNLTARNSGQAGTFIVDDGELDLGLSTLVEAQDAVVFFGSSDPAQAIAITSATNQLTGVVPGATIDLVGTGSATATVNRDDSSIVSNVEKFVKEFNAVVAAIDKHDSYDTETEERGLLLGDPTVGSIKRQMFSLATRRNTSLEGQFNSLTQIGITVGSGAKLQFDSAKFTDALATDRESVRQLFSFKETERDELTNRTNITAAGVGVSIQEMLKRFTETTLQNKFDSIESRVELNNDRIDRLDQQIESKRERLTSQFIAMERALAEMQGQQNALGQIQSIAPSSGLANLASL